jgi:ubiquinone/menaquinone biosynthesis C-methylase UbiE
MNPNESAPSPKDFFSKHAEDYANSESHAHGSDLSRLVELLDPKPNEIALDVGTGTGFTAMELAHHASRVVAIDITEEMLQQARKLAMERGILNIQFEKGDASHISYHESFFDIVTTRRATHHFADVGKFLREAARVLKKGGRLGIVDMSPPRGAEEFTNRIEILRDKTRTKALSPFDWREEISRAGLSVTNSELLKETISFEAWMYPVKMGGTEETLVKEAWMQAPDCVREILEAREGRNGNVESWTKQRIVTIAKKG